MINPSAIRHKCKAGPQRKLSVHPGYRNKSIRLHAEKCIFPLDNGTVFVSAHVDIIINANAYEYTFYVHAATVAHNKKLRPVRPLSIINYNK